MTHRFTSPDIQACRDWLRLFGFHDGAKGWTRADGAAGSIAFWQGEFYAAYSAGKEG